MKRGRKDNALLYHWHATIELRGMFNLSSSLADEVYRHYITCQTRLLLLKI